MAAGAHGDRVPRCPGRGQGLGRRGHAVPAPGQRAGQASATRQRRFRYGDYYAYSKICTHVGCPVSLYEQQTGRILCPCHQSQFDVNDGAKPVFGPATRPLPQLPITVDDEGYFIAVSDFIEPVGPGFWENQRRGVTPDEPTHDGDHGATEAVAGGQGRWTRRTSAITAPVRCGRDLNKVFPTHWSFMLGEVAMYSFIILLLSGVYLTLFFDASMGETVYQGVYDKLRGVPMSLRLRVDARHLVRGPRRSADPADPPLGGAAVPGLDDAAHDADLLHRRHSASRARPTGSSACCCWCSAWPRASSATPCRTTCCPAPACGRSARSCCRSR